MSTFSYGDPVAFENEDVLRYGVVTAVIDRKDASGDHERLEISVDGQTTITVDANKAAEIPSAAYSQFDRLVTNHPRAKWAKDQSEKLLNPPKPSAEPAPIVDPLKASADSLRDVAVPTESAAGAADTF